MGSREIPLIFVFLGPRLPGYALHSIRRNLETSGFSRIILLGNGTRPRGLDSSVEFVPVESFYDPQNFEAFRSRSTLSPTFREGFWLKTTERLYVLAAFANRFNESLFVHAELDVLLLRPQSLIERVLELELPGVFLPRESKDLMMASFILVTSADELREILRFVTDHADTGNEMEILGKASLSQARLPIYSLPSVEALFRNSSECESPWIIHGLADGTLIDGAVIGRWLLGVDPRNTPNLGTRNLIQNPPYTVPFSPALKELSFEFNPRTWDLDVHRQNVTFRVAAIHVHSKIFSQLTARRLHQIVKKANKGRPSVLVTFKPVRIQNQLRRLAKDFRLYVYSKKFRQNQNRRIATKLGVPITRLRKNAGG